MTGRRLLAALGTSACVAAVARSAIAAGLRAIDRELASYTTEIRNVPVNWISEFDAWEAGQ